MNDTPKFAKGGLIRGPADPLKVPITIESSECVISRARVCLRGDDPGHDPQNSTDRQPRWWWCSKLDGPRDD